jgi:quinol monooxygenase YgiN
LPVRLFVRSLSKRVFGASLSLLALALGGCAIATPYRALPQSSVPPQDAIVVVAITKAVVDPATRGPFDAQVRAVLRALPDQPGLVGYSVRREIFGRNLWTMTVWESDAALVGFAGGMLHQEAVRVGSPALQDSRFARLKMARNEAPLTWPQALEILRISGRDY